MDHNRTFTVNRKHTYVHLNLTLYHLRYAGPNCTAERAVNCTFLTYLPTTYITLLRNAILLSLSLTLSDTSSYSSNNPSKNPVVFST